MARSRTSTRQELVQATDQRLATFHQQVQDYGAHFRQALPKHVSLEKFQRTLVTAAATNPDLLHADRRTLFLAGIKCAADGLEPDGRQAALVIYNTKIKRRDPQTRLDVEFRIDAVQYMPMIAGIRERMRNTGQVDSADAQVVYEKDAFHYALGDNAYIDHKPPPLNEERGEIIGAYAIIRLKNGEVLRDVMSRREIEVTRSQSRAKDSLMWTKYYGEAARKTVLRRCSKAAPQTSELERLMDRDDEPLPTELPALPELSSLPAYQPKPVEPEPPGQQTAANQGGEFEVVDLEGQVFDYHEAKTAAEALRRVYAAAEQRGLAFLTGAVETNAELQIQLERHGENFEMPPTEPARPRTEAKADPAGGFFGAEPPEHAHSAPPPADAVQPFPGDQPSRQIAIPTEKGGGQDYRTWALALFLPRVRQMNASNDLAMLLGDNEKNLEDARRHLSAHDLRELETEITTRWDEIGEIERQEA